MIFYIFGTLFLDLISKMASRKKRKLEFEVPKAVTTLCIVVSGLQRLIAFYITKPDNYMCTFFLPNTLKWIVIQKVIVHFANKHNKLKNSYQLKKRHAKRLRLDEGTQLKRKLKVQVNYLERPCNIGSRKQFEICRKWDRLDEGVFMAKKSKHNKKVVFLTTCNKRASTVDEIDQINLSEVKDQEPAPHLGCTLNDVGSSEIGLEVFMKITL